MSGIISRASYVRWTARDIVVVNHNTVEEDTGDFIKTLVVPKVNHLNKSSGRYYIFTPIKSIQELIDIFTTFSNVVNKVA